MEENNISFAEFIKNEILEFDWNDTQLDILFYSFLKTNCVFKKKEAVLGTPLKDKVDLFKRLFKQIFDVEVEVKELETKVNLIIRDETFQSKFYEIEDNLNLANEDEVRAFIAGSFIGKGWISKPSSRFYHLEFRIGSIEHSINLQEAIDSLGLKTKTVQKGNWHITYLKKAMDLTDLLGAMNALEAMMIFEDERMNRDFTSTYFKMETIEAYNIQKTRQVSNLQIEAIDKLDKHNLLKTLKTNIYNIALIRKEYPDYSLSDLQYVFNEKYKMNVSKSCINNWLKSILERAESL